MATKKDLVEAHAFSRRRLVTAFLSGAPGGREVEPSRPGRTIVGGAALALLVIAAGAILGALVGRTQEGWDQQSGLVIGKGTGDLYAVLQPAADGQDLDLRPVRNTVSGRLIFGDQSPNIVDDDVLRGYPLGPEIGIDGAPRQLPDADDLVPTGWTACTDISPDPIEDLQLSITIEQEPEVTELTGTAFVVRSQEDKLFLIADSAPDAGDPSQAYRYLVPQNPATDNLLVGLGLRGITARAAPEVPDAWLRLFDPGGALNLSSFDTAGFGTPATQAGLPRGTRYGDYFTVADPDGRATDTYVATPEGPAQLDPFSAAVYVAAHRPGARERPLSAAPPGLVNPGFTAGNHWPTAGLEPFLGESAACAELTTSDDGPVLVRMAGDPTGEAAPADASEPVRYVEPTHGAFVHVRLSQEVASRTGLPTELAVVIAPDGQAYPVKGETAIANLGYADVAAPLVPGPWITLFPQDGRPDAVELSYEEALCTPDARPAGHVLRRRVSPLPAAVVLAALVGFGPASAGAAQPALASPARALAAAAPDCANQTGDTGAAAGELSPGVPATELGIDEVRDLIARTPARRRTVTIAVLDSGIARNGRVSLDRDRSDTEATVAEPPGDPHGTTVAGIIAGRATQSGVTVGFAPEATLVDLQVSGREDDERDADAPPDPAVVADALEQVLALDREAPVDIATMAFGMPEDATVEQLVARLRERDVVVVAASGNRGGAFAFLDADGVGEYRGSEDVAELVYPAGYLGVVAVNATADGLAATEEETGDASPTGGPASQAAVPDASGTVLANSRTDVAAPTAGGLSYDVSGRPCSVLLPDTTMAAAEVTGILALLMTAFPDDTDEQTLARLKETAAGVPGAPTKFLGRGVVQPLAALQAPLLLTKDGAVPTPTAPPRDLPVTVADPPPNPLGSTRRDLLWWSLVGAGGLALTLLLAPVLSRRRIRPGRR